MVLGGAIRLPRGRIHEVMGQAADMFAMAVAAQTKGALIWIGQREAVESLCPTGFQRFFDPTRVITTFCLSRREIFWAAEQSLRTLKKGCVFIELNDGPDLKESRRLQIAAEEGGTLGIILIARRAQTSAAHTRWVCNPSCEGSAPWIWKLTKNKSGNIGVWRVGWREKSGDGGDAPDIILMAAAAAA